MEPRSLPGRGLAGSAIRAAVQASPHVQPRIGVINLL